MAGEGPIEEECYEKSAVQRESPDDWERGACRYLDGVPNRRQQVRHTPGDETAIESYHVYLWVKVTAVVDGQLHGTMENNPVYDVGYECGEAVIFRIPEVED